MTNRLTGFFLAGNALMWLDFGDTKLNELDWSFSNHTLNYAAVIASETTPIGDLIVYDLCDRGKFIDTDNVNLTERYPAFNIAKMLKVIFSGYDLQTNFINESWFTDIYLLFTQTREIRNDDDWKESALISGSGNLDVTDNTIYMYGPTVDWDRTDDYFNATFIGDDEFDNGSNWDDTNKWYLVPETGTYRFKLTIDGDAYLRTEISAVPTGQIVYAQFTVSMRINDITVLARVFVDDSDGSEHGEMIFNNYVIDSDCYELTAGDKISIHTYYKVRIHPANQSVYWLYTSDINFKLTNQVTRYYGHGSTVQTSALMPDLKVNDFLKMVFQHFAIVPQYSYETNIVRLNVWQRQQTSFDITPYIDTSTGTTDFSEAFDFELLFRVDSADRWAQEYYTLNPDNTGKYEASNGNKNKEVYTSAFSNTVLQVCFRLDADKVAIPVLWGELPESTVPYPHDSVAEWKTTFNYRLLKYLGVDSVNTYKFGYHVAGDGRTITDENFALFTPFSGLEFCNNGATIGLYERLHKAFIARLNNGTTLTINGRLPLTYLNDLINNDADTNLTTPVYIGLNPFVGRYTVRSITNNGIQDQLVLILNDE